MRSRRISARPLHTPHRFVAGSGGFTVPDRGDEVSPSLTWPIDEVRLGAGVFVGAHLPVAEPAARATSRLDGTSGTCASSQSSSPTRRPVRPSATLQSPGPSPLRAPRPSVLARLPQMASRPQLPDLAARSGDPPPQSNDDRRRKAGCHQNRRPTHTPRGKGLQAPRHRPEPYPLTRISPKTYRQLSTGCVSIE
jgi:hypothetical protein